SHAARVPIEIGGFQAYLESFGGGLKGMVLAERDLRRPAGKQAVDRFARIREELRAAPVKARLPLAAGDNEFVLLVARRQPDGMLGVVEAVPHNAGLVDKALSSLAAG